MTTPTISVPVELRPLLERIVQADCDISGLHMGVFEDACDRMDAAMAELRALLTAQPQASAAQSAPAGEREAVEVVAWRIEHPAKQWKVYEQRQDWAYQEYGHIKYEVQDLMTVAQHQRITAAMAAEGVEWIACSERLPSKVEWCLVFADGAMNCMAFNNGNWEDWVSAALPNIRAGEITHWMPLPAAPALSAAQAGGGEE